MQLTVVALAAALTPIYSSRLFESRECEEPGTLRVSLAHPACWPVAATFVAATGQKKGWGNEYTV